ncbi:MAG: hypothetical protein FWG90_09455 [Oscillospiraceae bacterium]|nr:hypothetical protein [Oscillospiraceae bacterium]
MATSLETREKNRQHLNSLLKVKKLNLPSVVIGLQQEIEDAVVLMDQEDVSWVEKIVGISAL